MVFRLKMRVVVRYPFLRVMKKKSIPPHLFQNIILGIPDSDITHTKSVEVEP